MIIRWVHPAQVMNDGVTLKPTAFTLDEIRDFYCHKAPSVNIASAICSDNFKKVKKAACNYCKGSKYRGPEEWFSPQLCQAGESACAKATAGARGAVSPEEGITTITVSWDNVERHLCVTPNPSKNNPAHGLIQTFPLVNAGLDRSLCMKVQLKLTQTFKCRGTVDQVLQKIA